MSELSDIETRLRELEAERDRLEAFKTYVHARLDADGVPVDPDSSHRSEGCRVGGRLDWLLAERDALRAGRLSDPLLAATFRPMNEERHALRMSLHSMENQAQAALLQVAELEGKLRDERKTREAFVLRCTERAKENGALTARVLTAEQRLADLLAGVSTGEEFRIKLALAFDPSGDTDCDEETLIICAGRANELRLENEPMRDDIRALIGELDEDRLRMTRPDFWEDILARYRPPLPAPVAEEPARQLGPPRPCERCGEMGEASDGLGVFCWGCHPGYPNARATGAHGLGPVKTLPQERPNDGQQWTYTPDGWRRGGIPRDIGYCYWQSVNVFNPHNTPGGGAFFQV